MLAVYVNYCIQDEENGGEGLILFGNEDTVLCIPFSSSRNNC